MQLHVLQYVLWFSAPLLQVGVLIFMYRRGLQRDYPVFFNYTILQVLTFLFLAAAQAYSYRAYYFGYWTTVALNNLLAFAVLQEIFRDAFRPFEALRDLSVILFRWSALVVMLVVGMSAITNSNSMQVDTVTDTILLLERNVRIMQCGLVFFLLLFSEYLGISRRHILFGISVGFGFFAATNMLVATAMSHSTVIKRSTLSEINSAAYVVACVIWLGYVWSPFSVRAGQLNAEATAINKALVEAHEPISTESVLETIDRMVDDCWPLQQGRTQA